ncbi:hypothetical protein [Fluviicola chungangensis]|uniref:WG repeat-containing protein n=1 Tax=Fluviicola chungangensis TaxID=2597671 RepID=A0A556MMR8_9FLAO|nr:hypothetical protein [Fluviicola chungangensis]TSJ41213.1 hypothetical protein FO442_14980 [Fluviicola chungangensis]
METNWNQLIERYLQNELSEEGKNAFEQELQFNPELREELEMHQLIQSAAKRASQRNMIRQTGKMYLRNLRIKQFAVGVVVTTLTAAGIVYWIQTKHKSNTSLTENVSANSEVHASERNRSAVRIDNQPNQSGGKSSLIQPTDWQMAKETDFRSKTTLTGLKSAHSDFPQEVNGNAVVKGQGTGSSGDSLPAPKPTVAILGYTNDKLKGEVIETKVLNGAMDKNLLWIQKYDSVGKFNDLYCGYALVMDKAKFGFVDPEGKIFIPIKYDQIVVTTNIKSSKQKNKRQKKKVLYIPKRSGKDVKDCEEANGKISNEWIAY